MLQICYKKFKTRWGDYFYTLGMVSRRKSLLKKRGVASFMACALLFSIIAPPFAQAKEYAEQFNLRNKLKTVEYNPALAQAILERTPQSIRSQIEKNLKDRHSVFRLNDEIFEWFLKFFIERKAQFLFAVITIGIDQIYWMVTGHALHLELVAGIASAIPPSVPDPISPTPDIVKKSLKAFTYSDPSQNFEGVDLDHYIDSLIRLTEMATEKRLEEYGAYEDLISKGYDAGLIDSINGKSFRKREWDYIIDRQNDDPRSEAVFQAVMNSLTALGLELSQFGIGVKQIIDWLEPNGKDRLNVTTAKEGKAYRLSILRSKAGQLFIQPPKEIGLNEFQKAAGKNYSSGTVVKVTVKNKIPQKEGITFAGERTSSQSSIVKGIHEKFPFITAAKITTEMEWEGVVREVNGFKEKELLAGVGGPTLEEDRGREVSVRFTDYSLAIVDNGEGMDAERMSKMFVPKYGSSNPPPLDLEGVKRELKKVSVVQDKTLQPHAISFSRNGRSVVTVEIPKDIVKESTIEGGLTVEGGSLIDVPPEWNKILIPKDPTPDQKSNFRKGMEQAVRLILQQPDSKLSKIDKLKVINTIAIGLDGLIQKNRDNEQAVKAIRTYMKDEIFAILKKLEEEGFIILPHHTQFEQLLIPEGKKALFLHENIFDWQGAANLSEMRGEIVPGITLGGKKNLPLVIIPFKQDRLKFILKFNRLWHKLLGKERIPMIRTDRFIAIPVEVGGRLLELAKKRVDGLNEQEEREFRSLLQRVNILTAEQVSSKKAKVKENLRLAPVSELSKNEAGIDSHAIKKFLTKPPLKLHQEEPLTSVPSDANMKYALLNGDVIQIGTGEKIKNIESSSNFKLSDITNLTYLGKVNDGNHGLYLLEVRNHEYTYATFDMKKGTLSTYKALQKRESFRISAHNKIFIGEDIIFNFESDKYDAIEILVEQSIVQRFIDISLSDIKNIQFSSDEKYATFLITQGDIKYFAAIDVDSWKVTKFIPLGSTNEDFDYSMNPLTNSIVFIRNNQNKTAPLTLIDLSDGRMFQPVEDARGVKYLNIDPSGTYTAIVAPNGKMSLYFHKARELITSDNFPTTNEIYSVSTIYKIKKGELVPEFQVYLRNTPHYSDNPFSEPDELFSIDENLNILSAIPQTGTIQITYDVHNSIDVKGYVPSSPNFNFYKHPHFDLFIDDSEAQKIALDPKTGDTFQYEGEIIHYDSSPQQSTLYTLNNGNMVAYWEDGDEAAFLNAITDKQPANYVIYVDAGEYYIRDFKKFNHMVTIPLGIYKQNHSSVIFDGKYFVFIGPYTIYLDPENLNNPTLVPVAGDHLDSGFEELGTVPSGTVPNSSISKPEGATTRFILLNENTLLDTHSGTKIAIEVNDKIAISIEHINENVFLAYNEQGDFKMFRENKSPKNPEDKFTLIAEGFVENGDQIFDYTDKLVLIQTNENTTHRMYVIDLEKGTYLPTEQNSYDIHLSASGNYSVHLNEEGLLTNYDHTEKNPTPKLILSGGFSEYLVHDRADVVIWKSADEGKYNLFNLSSGLPIIIDADHIEIDSTGKLAIAKFGDRLRVFDLVNGEKIGPSEKTIVAQVKISSDDKSIFVMAGESAITWVGRYEKNTMGTINLSPFELMADLSTPRFLESYTLTGKVIWDREKQIYLVDDNIFEYSYDQNIITDPASLSLLLHGSIRFSHNFIDAQTKILGIISPRNLEKNSFTSIHYITGVDGSPFKKQKLKSLTGGKVLYSRIIGNVNRDDVIITKEKFFNVYNPRVNQNKTFLLAKSSYDDEKKAAYLLIDSEGNSTEIARQIPEGFEPKDADGKYFVFVHKETGEIAYLDPEDPEELVFITAPAATNIPNLESDPKPENVIARSMADLLLDAVQFLRDVRLHCKSYGNSLYLKMTVTFDEIEKYFEVIIRSYKESDDSQYHAIVPIIKTMHPVELLEKFLDWMESDFILKEKSTQLIKDKITELRHEMDLIQSQTAKETPIKEESVHKPELESQQTPALEKVGVWFNTNLPHETSQFIISENSDGTFSLVPSDLNLSAEPKPENRWNCIDRVNTNTFLCYREPDTAMIVKPSLEGFLIETVGIILDYNSTLIVAMHSGSLPMVYDVSSENIGRIGSSKIEISSSGRYTVHKAGGLYYYDHTEEKPTKRKIIDEDFISEYLAHDRADVVIFKGKNGKSYLYSLSLGRIIIDLADHIDIDSSGKVAIAITGGHVNAYELVKGEVLDAARVARMSGKGGELFISSDERFVYICSNEINTIVSNSVFVYEKESMIETENIKDLPLPSLPHFWEYYNFERKSIWDNRKKILLKEYAFPYQWNSHLNRISNYSVLHGSNIVTKQYPGRSIRAENLESGDLKTMVYGILPPKFGFLEGEKVRYTLIDNLPKEAVVTTSDKFFVVDNPLINESKTALLGLHFSGIYLFDSEGEQINITTQIPEGFEPVDVNGDYFIFMNPDGVRLTLSPKPIEGNATSSTKEELESKELGTVPDGTVPNSLDFPKGEVEENMFRIWKEGLWEKVGEGLSRRDRMIAQAQAAYRPFLEAIPKGEKGEIEKILKKRIEKLYEGQEREIVRWFKGVGGLNKLGTVPEGTVPNLLVADFVRALEDEKLPFDRFLEKMGPVNARLSEYLSSVRSKITQESPGFQRSFYGNIFENLFDLAMDGEIDMGNWGQSLKGQSPISLYQSIGLGYKITTQEELDDLEIIVQFWKLLLKEASFEDTARIISFLSQVGKKDSKRHKIIIHQIKKFLALQEPNPMVTGLIKAFFQVNEEALEKYIDKNEITRGLGSAKTYVVYLTQNVGQVQGEEEGTELKPFIPEGETVPMPKEGIQLSQISLLETERAKGEDSIMSLDYLKQRVQDHLDPSLNYRLPKPSKEIEGDRRRNVKLQGESGTDAREAMQNFLDAMKVLRKVNPKAVGELVVRFYVQKNKGRRELVKEFSDNATGAFSEVALLIEQSTKDKGNKEINLTGLFGIGLSTLFQGADRVEMINNNGKRATMFTIQIDKNDAGEITKIFMPANGLREIEDKRVKQGFTFRHISYAENTIPALEQMLTREAWKIYAGLAQDENTKIYFEDHKGVREPLEIKVEVLSEVPFSATKPGKKKETIFGMFRLISAPEIPSQIRDNSGQYGLTVSELKPEYLALIPEPLRHYFDELGISIQIPLPLIRGRSGFQYGSDYLPTIQKYVAIEFYKALAYKTITEREPIPFSFGNFPSDWWESPDYSNWITPADASISKLAQKIKRGTEQGTYGEIRDENDNEDDITNGELAALLTEEDRLDKNSKALKLILLLEVEIPGNKLGTVPEGTVPNLFPNLLTSLWLQRLAAQEKINAKRAEEEMKRYRETTGQPLSPEWLEDLNKNPQNQKWVNHGKKYELTSSQMARIGEFVVDPEMNRKRENRQRELEIALENLALEIAQNFGIQQVKLVNEKFSTPIAFGLESNQQGTAIYTLYVRRSLARILDKEKNLDKDSVTDIILEHIAYMLQKKMEFDDQTEHEEKELWAKGIVWNPSPFKNDKEGLHAKTKQYASSVSLTNYRAILSSIALGLVTLGISLFGISMPAFADIGNVRHSGESRNLVNNTSLLDSGFRRNDDRGGNNGQGKLGTVPEGTVPNFRVIADLMERQLDSSVYQFFYNRTLQALKENSQKNKNQMVLIDLNDERLLKLVGDHADVPVALHYMITGIVRGIEEYEKQNPERRTYISFVSNSNRASEIAQAFIERYQIHSYVLEDFKAAKTPLEAVTICKEKNLEISYVFTSKPSEWIKHAVNWIKLISGEEVKIFWNGKEIHIKKEEQPTLEEIKNLWQQTETLELNA